MQQSPGPKTLATRALVVPHVLFAAEITDTSPSASSTVVEDNLPILTATSGARVGSQVLLVFLSAEEVGKFSDSTIGMSYLFTGCKRVWPQSGYVPSAASGTSSGPRPSSAIVAPSLPAFSVT